MKGGRRRFLIRSRLLLAASYREMLHDEMGPYVGGGSGGVKRDVFAALKVKDTSGCYAAKKKCDET